jgi:hypothetical protein
LLEFQHGATPAYEAFPYALGGIETERGLLVVVEGAGRTVLIRTSAAPNFVAQPRFKISQNLVWS